MRVLENPGRSIEVETGARSSLAAERVSRFVEEERMDAVTRHTPAPKTFGPGRVLYELAGPADPTWDELSTRMQRAYQAAARFLTYHDAVEKRPSIEQPPPLHSDPVEAYECQVVAAVSVLKRSPVVMRGEWAGAEPDEVQLRALAEQLVAAVDTGI